MGNDDGQQRGRVMVVGGTHGNERHGLWLLDQWSRHPALLNSHDLALEWVIGNPLAARDNRRYVDRDLNRSFRSDLLADTSLKEWEVDRARQLLDQHGPQGRRPALVAIDLHSTTAAMGNSLVLYDRRPATLALAAAMQSRLGLPIYLHESDPHQSGYLASCWPCALVIEVGPIAQGLLSAAIGQQTQIALETGLEILADARAGRLSLGRDMLIHTHVRSIDLPRHADGSAAGLVHPWLQNRDWQPLRCGDPLFLGVDGTTIRFKPEGDDATETFWPVFINEAAYGEKGIALSLTRREPLKVAPDWAPSLSELAGRLDVHPS